MAIDKQKVKKRAADEQEFLETLKFQNGQTQIRVLEIAGTGDYEYITYAHFRVGPDEKVVTCPKQTWGEPCPICEEVEQLREDGNEDEAYQKSVRKSGWMICINRADGQLYKVAPVKTIRNEIKGYILNEKLGDITHPTKGRDLIVTKTGSGFKGKNPTRFKVELDPEGKSPAVFKEVDGEIVFDKKGWEKIVAKVGPDVFSGLSRKLTYEQIQAVMEGRDPEDVDTGDGDEDDAPFDSPKKAKNDKPKKGKGKKAEDDEEDEGDGEEESDDSEEDEEPPKKKGKVKPKKVEEDDEDEEEDSDEDDESDDSDEDSDDEEEDEPKPKKKGKAKPKDDEEDEDEESDESEDDDEEDSEDDDDEDEEPPKKKGKAKPKEDEDDSDESEDGDLPKCFADPAKFNPESRKCLTCDHDAECEAKIEEQKAKPKKTKEVSSKGKGDKKVSVHKEVDEDEEDEPKPKKKAKK